MVPLRALWNLKRNLLHEEIEDVSDDGLDLSLSESDKMAGRRICGPLLEYISSYSELIEVWKYIIPTQWITTFMSGILSFDFKLSLQLSTESSCPFPILSINFSSGECDMHKYHNTEMPIHIPKVKIVVCATCSYYMYNNMCTHANWQILKHNHGLEWRI